MSDTKNISFMINASNQANIYKTENNNTLQINSIFLFVDGYKLEALELEELQLEIKIDKDGNFIIENNMYQPIEIKDGVKLLALVK
ncbi:hypothetical protein F8154_09385 [Alkaliphilus pronyensis]|uniref:Uncharacterized protein n=1 Tax=Alkaliphilus pronyensis TaxID=1482732 RepID=A0A6I0EYV8_9FIRM|nr:hypothetical protein [Alkaliphilus pronyensis]KAB3534140.1 hypothetical protein F8154_09385 [Alkaliphilus pronyensis]